jgi:glycosyltransferase involved in cell wall biosynthesis
MLQQMGVSVYAGRDTAWAGAEFLPDASELLTFGAFDVVIFHFWWVAARHLAEVRRLSPKSRVIVDTVDLHFVRRTRSRFQSEPRESPTGVLDERDAAEMAGELNVYAAADAVLTVSAKEAALVNDLVGRPFVAHVVPDSEALTQSRYGYDDRRGLLFLGNFRHLPNVDALTYLCRDIVPEIPSDLLQRHPISVVGNDLTEALATRCGARQDVIRLVGWVPSVEPYLERALMTIAPLRVGAGTKRKIIQASMVGTPTVSTRIGVEGLPLVDRVSVLVGDDPATFAAHVAALAQNRDLWHRLTEAARRSVLSSHNREVARDSFNRVLNHVMSR